MTRIVAMWPQFPYTAHMRTCFILTWLLCASTFAGSMQLSVVNLHGQAAAGYPYKLFEVEIFEGEEMIIKPFEMARLDAQGGLLLKDLTHRLQLSHPGAVINQLKQTADNLNTRLSNALQENLEDSREVHTNLAIRLRNASPDQQLEHIRSLLSVRQQ